MLVGPRDVEAHWSEGATSIVSKLTLVTPVPSRRTPASRRPAVDGVKRPARLDREDRVAPRRRRQVEEGVHLRAAQVVGLARAVGRADADP